MGTLVAAVSSTVVPRPNGSDGAKLVNDAKFVSAHPDEGGKVVVGRRRRRRRFDLLRVLWKVSEMHRQRACCRSRIDAGGVVSVHKSPEGFAYFSNLQRCGYGASCPVCGAKIAQKRAEEIEAAALRHLDKGGGGWSCCS